jgi:SagB-type dehydrogenase family enzyme
MENTAMIDRSDAIQTVIEYHERTKHHFDRYARSAGYLDWNNQPDPFREYLGTQRVHLPLIQQPPEMSYAALFQSGSAPGLDLTLAHLGTFLQLSMGISAWKQAGASRWALRANPSSGNLHPTECHLILPTQEDIPGGVYHYSPLRHALEKRADLPDEAGALLRDHFESPGFLLALTTIFWRESWKYGERAWRYCNLDIGHALAALALAARLNHWLVVGLGHAGDQQISTLLGFDKVDWLSLEAEVPELICWVAQGPPADERPHGLSQSLVKAFEQIKFAGQPNALSHQPLEWSVIPEAAAAAKKPAGAQGIPEAPPVPFPISFPPPGAPLAAGIIRQRRSAVRYDPRSTIDAEAFAALLDRTCPGSRAPFDAALAPPAVQLLLFVHRVRGMAPGLYLLARVPDQIAALRQAADSGFLWQPAHARLPLWLLKPGDVALEAMELSCHQEIAGQSAFCVAMIAPFRFLVFQHPFLYRHLHWECGMIGQTLYLEAEAQGLRGTGIGCFFDDGVHDLMGFRDNQFQSLYHFTIGHPIEDRRITTLPAYHHRQKC